MSTQQQIPGTTDLDVSQTSSPVPQASAFAPQHSFLDRLADRLDLSANTRAVFGPPVERDGTTVIPVAKAQWGMGGGSRAGAGSPAQQGQPPAGGGGGASVVPVGFIELSGGSARFRSIRDPASTARIILFAGLFGISALKAIAGTPRRIPGRKVGLGRARRFRRVATLFGYKRRRMLFGA